MSKPYIGVIIAIPSLYIVNRLGTGYLYNTEVEEILLPPKYKAFAEVFSKEASIAVLLEYIKVRYSILIEEGKTIPYRPIYIISERELRVLREYITKAI